jgi:adenylosuccinate synthase
LQQYIIVLSGSIASGKSTLAEKLSKHYEGYIFKTNIVLKEIEVLKRRKKLQNLGDKLDRETGGRWVQTSLEEKRNELLDKGKSPKITIVDSVRIESQIEWLRKAYGKKVVHIHLDAEIECLAQRYKERHGSIVEVKDYETVRKNKTEKNVSKLASKADIVIQTDRCNEEDVFVRACSHLKIGAHTVIPLVDVLIGGQYGSEGKGNVAAFIAPEYKYLVRVGGPNAGHKVFGDPVYTFHHLPSGTNNAPDARILLGPGMVINLEGLLKEIADCKLSYARLSIDPNAIIIEKSDIEFENEQLGSISSTCQGVGSATARRILERGKKAENKGGVLMAADVPELRLFVRPIAPILEKAYSNLEPILLEGTQGTSLSLYHGEYPYVTSRDTTVAGCLTEAGISPRRVRKVILVCRTYPIRVGDPKKEKWTSGPMSQQITYEELSKRSGIDIDVLLKTELTSTTGKQRRIAEFNWVQLKQSVILNAPTDIALTFVDYLDIENQTARRYEQLQTQTINFIEEVERVSKAPVSLISTRFSWRSIIDRRSW